MSDTTIPPQFTSALGDPFDPAGASNLHQPGFLGVSPDVWRSLANFGANMASSANARTPGGFLANGTGFAGPFAAAVGQSQQQGLARGQALADMSYRGALAQNAMTDALLKRFQIPLMQQEFGLLQQGINGLGNGGPLGMAESQPQTQSQPSSGGVPFAANNPLNMRYVGQSGATNTNGFAAFPTPEAGKAATDSLFDRYAQTGVNTLRGLISRWAPSTDNNPTDAYINHVSKQTGIDPDQQIDLTSPTIKAVVQHAMGGFEGNKNANVPNAFQVAQAGNGPIPTTGGQSANLPTNLQPSASTADYTKDPAYQRAMQLYRMATVYGISPLTSRLAETYKSMADQQLQLAFAGPKATAEAASKAAIDLQTAGPLALSKAQNSNIDLREGGLAGLAQGNGQYQFVKNPKLERVQDPATGQETYAHISPAMPGSPEGTPGTAEPVLVGGKPAVAEMPVAQKEFQETRGKGLAEQFQQVDEAAAHAKESNYLFDNMRADSQTWDMNKFASWEGDARAYMKAIANSFGIKTPQMDQQIADFTAFNKSSGMLLREAVHETSSRAAVQEYNMIGNTLPNPTSTKEAFEQISAQWQGLNDFRLAKQQFASNYDGKPKDFNVNFNSSLSPTSFMLNRLSQTPEGQQTMQGMLGRMQQTPEGRLLAKRMLQQYQYAKSNGYFNDLPPTGAGQ